MQTSAEETLLEKLRSLPAEKITEVEDLIDFLRQRDDERRFLEAATRLSEDALPTAAQMLSAVLLASSVRRPRYTELLRVPTPPALPHDDDAVACSPSSSPTRPSLPPAQVRRAPLEEPDSRPSRPSPTIVARCHVDIAATGTVLFLAADDAAAKASGDADMIG
jgi:hypothetical protein